MTQCHECVTDRAITTEGRLSRIEASLEAINDKLDDAILSQLRDHGKRIGALERRGWLAIGYMIGSGALGAAAARLLG